MVPYLLTGIVPIWQEFHGTAHATDIMRKDDSLWHHFQLYSRTVTWSRTINNLLVLCRILQDPVIKNHSLVVGKKKRGHFSHFYLRIWYKNFTASPFVRWKPFSVLDRCRCWTSRWRELTSRVKRAELCYPIRILLHWFQTDDANSCEPMKHETSGC